MWDIKLRATNSQTRKTNKNSQTQTTEWWLPEGREAQEQERAKRVKYLLSEKDLTLGGGHTMPYADHVRQNCTLEAYIIILFNDTPRNSIKKNESSGKA